MPRKKKPGPRHEPVLLFHWAPRARRAGIIRRGLVPGMRSTCNQWRPPYVCFADSPGWAWALSAQMHPEIEQWDLWCVWTNRLQGWEELPCAPGDRPSGVYEYRVYHRIMKRDLWFVGSRAQRGERA